MINTNNIKHLGNIYIVGYGTLGEQLHDSILKSKYEMPKSIFIDDPDKGYIVNNNITADDIVFIQIHIPTNTDYIYDDSKADFVEMNKAGIYVGRDKQNLKVICSILEKYKNAGDIFIRTTIDLASFGYLKEKFENIHFMPEFLRQDYAYVDFKNQPIIDTSSNCILNNIFGDNYKYIYCSDEEAILAKYYHNAFNAFKVQYFNNIYQACKRYELDYSNVREVMLSSSFINDVGTTVPGKDNMFGFGGKCFPKDVLELAYSSIPSRAENRFFKMVYKNNLEQRVFKYLPKYSLKIEKYDNGDNNIINDKTIIVVDIDDTIIHNLNNTIHNLNNVGHINNAIDNRLRIEEYRKELHKLYKTCLNLDSILNKDYYLTGRLFDDVKDVVLEPQKLICRQSLDIDVVKFKIEKLVELSKIHNKIIYIDNDMEQVEDIARRANFGDLAQVTCIKTKYLYKELLKEF